MTITHLGNGVMRGLSTDTKPTTFPTGAVFLETDTGNQYYYTGSTWLLQNGSAGLSPGLSGKHFGVRQGFNANVSATTAGIGLLQSVTAGNGTGAAGATGTDTTDGSRCNWITGTNNTFARAGYWGFNITARKFNPTYTVRFRLSAAQTSSNAILYIGFVNQSAQPTAGTSMLSTYLNSKIGVLFGFRASDTTWMIMSNNNQTTAVYTALTGLPNSGATDNTAHTLSIRLDDATPAIRWSFDNVIQTAITDTTNSVPPSTTLVNPIIMLEAQSATGLTICERWSHVQHDAV